MYFNLAFLLLVVAYIGQLVLIRNRLIRVYGKLDPLLRATTEDNMNFLRSPRILKKFSVYAILKRIDNRSARALEEKGIPGPGVEESKA